MLVVTIISLAAWWSLYRSLLPWLTQTYPSPDTAQTTSVESVLVGITWLVVHIMVASAPTWSMVVESTVSGSTWYLAALLYKHIIWQVLVEHG